MDVRTRRRVGSKDEVKTNVNANIYYDTETRSSKGKWWLVLATAGLCFALAVVVIIILPSPIQPRAFSLPPPPEWTGPLAPNEKLAKAEKVYENQLVGPESLVRDGDYIYAGTADGRVVSISRGEVTTLARFGKGANCGSFESEPTCGRPLGMRLDKEGYLLVVDGYLGLYRVNVATGGFHQLLSSQTPLAGKRPQLLNDLDIGPDGVIYFSDSSTKWDRRHNRYLALEADNSGRLLSYDPASLHVEELMSGLAFANGVCVSYDKTHVLVVETTMARIWRYYIAGDRKGEREVFADNLPGLPDNIRQSGRGTYWVGFAVVRGGGRPSLVDFSAPRPWLRSLITKLMSQETIMKFMPKYGMIAELNKEGEIIRTLHDPSGTISASEVEEKDGVLYLGSYYLPFLSRLYLNRV